MESRLIVGQGEYLQLGASPSLAADGLNFYIRTESDEASCKGSCPSSCVIESLNRQDRGATQVAAAHKDLRRVERHHLDLVTSRLGILSQMGAHHVNRARAGPGRYRWRRRSEEGACCEDPRETRLLVLCSERQRLQALLLGGRPPWLVAPRHLGTMMAADADRIEKAADKAERKAAKVELAGQPTASAAWRGLNEVGWRD